MRDGQGLPSLSVRDGQGLPSLSVRDGQTLLSLSMNSGQIFYIQKNDILPTQAREGQTFPRVVPRAGKV